MLKSLPELILSDWYPVDLHYKLMADSKDLFLMFCLFYNIIFIIKQKLFEHLGSN